MKILYIDSIGEETALQNIQANMEGYQYWGDLLTFDYREEKDIDLMNSSLLSFILENKPDFIHIGKGERIFPEIIKKVRANYNPFIIHYFGDYEEELPDYVLSIDKEVDYAIICHKGDFLVNIYKSLNIKTFYWTPGIKKSDYEIIEEVNPIYDIIFIGNYLEKRGSSRLEILRFLDESSYKVLVCGNNWNQFNFKKIHLKDYVSSQEFIKECKSSKIILGEYNGITTPFYASWRRIFNSIASERLYLSSYFPGLESFFENKKHLVWFKDIKEMNELIKYYLDNEEERKKISLEGRKEVLENHTSIKKIKQLIDLKNL